MNIFKPVTDAVRGILFMIDSVVYGFIPTIYKLIIALANVDLYSNNPAIAALLNRIYIIVGVFMLFKLAFSMLRYLVDPNSFSDNSKGFTNLVKRILIAIVLLVSIPFLFGKIYEYQGVILNSGVLSDLILGTKEHNVHNMDEAATDLQFMMFGPFFSLNARKTTDDIVGNELEACAPGNPGDSDYRPLSNILGTSDMIKKDGCLEAFAAEMDKNSDVKASGSTINKFFKRAGADERNFYSLGGLLTWSLSDGDYAINYTPVISTICGGYLAFLLLSFCIDISVRAIKLLFLQILSPVAIITSIDPTSSSQNDKLKDWGMECLKTYISLFLRLIVIYTIIQMIYIITSKVFADNSSLYYSNFDEDALLNIWVYIFLILGAFSVAKKIPELIEKAFGIKMSGEINMNPFKTFRENVGTSLVGVGAAAVGGGLVNAAVSGSQAFTKSLENGPGGVKGGLKAAGSALTHGFGSGVAGMASTMNRGVRGVMHGDRGFKNMRNAYGSAMFARQQREDLHRQGVSYGDILKADIQRNLGIFTDAQQQQFDYDKAENELKGKESLLAYRKRLVAASKANELTSFKNFSDAAGKIKSMIDNDRGVKNFSVRQDELKKQGLDLKSLDAKKGSMESSYSAAEASYKAALSALEKARKSGDKSALSSAQANYDIVSDSFRRAKSKYDDFRNQYEEARSVDDSLAKAKTNAFQNLRNGTGDYNSQNAQYVGQLMSIMEEQRRANSEIAGFGDIVKADGSFNDAVYYSSNTASNRISDSYTMGIERELAEAEEELSNDRAYLESKKSSSEWRRNEKANSASRVNSPQPEGWMPTGEIQGQYRDTFGPSGWGGGPGRGPRPGGPFGGPGGPRPGGPGSTT